MQSLRSQQIQNTSFWSPLNQSYMPDGMHLLRLNDGRLICQSRDSIMVSADDGGSWSFLSKLVTFSTLLAVDSNGRLWAGMDEPQLQYSDDAGKSWSAISLPYKGEVDDVQCGGSDLYVTMNPPNMFDSIRVYHSPDRGSNWNTTSFAVDRSHTYEVAIAPNGDVYESQEFLYVKRSSDRGTTFTTTPFYAIGIYGDRMAAIDSAGLRYSTDRGATWTRNASVNSFFSYVSYLGFHGSDGVYAVAFNDVYFVDAPIKNPNAEWKLAGADYLTQIIPGRTRTVASGSGPTTVTNGLYYADPNGTVWHDQILIGPNSGSGIIQDGAGNYYVHDDSILYRSTDGGYSWRSVFQGLMGSAVALDGTIICTGEQKSRDVWLRSNQDGSQWDTIARVDTMALYRLWSVNRKLYLGASHTLFVSTDGAIHWQKVFQLTSGFCRSIIATKTGARIAIFGNTQQRSTDGGLTWAATTLPVSQINGFAELTSDTAGDLYQIMDSHLAISKDDGATWQKSQIALDHLAVGADGRLVVSSSQFITINGGTHQVATFQTSTDQGNTWQPMAETDTINAINQLAFGHDGHLFAATTGRVWHSTAAVSTPAMDVRERAHLSALHVTAVDRKHIEIISPVDGIGSIVILDEIGRVLTEQQIPIHIGSQQVSLSQEYSIPCFCTVTVGTSRQSCKF